MGKAVNFADFFRIKVHHPCTAHAQFTGLQHHVGPGNGGVAADFSGNVSQLLFFQISSIQHLQYLLILAILRSAAALVLRGFVRQHLLLKVEKERIEHLSEIADFSSSIHAFMFYLQKDCSSLETLTGKAYNLYEAVQSDPKTAADALDVAREIHEIKKDMLRTVKGLNRLRDKHMMLQQMQLSEICKIISVGYDALDSGIKLTFQFEKDHIVPNYIDYFVILNNLISNAMQAHAECIAVSFHEDVSQIQLSVLDDGDGILPGNLQNIFEPGFTTRSDAKTGDISNGLGLTHVQDIVDRLGGTIAVDLSGGYTNFVISLPKAENQL